MKKLFSTLALLVCMLNLTACAPPTVAVIELVANGTIQVLTITGTLTPVQSANIKTLATQAENDYTAYITAPAASKVTALQKFELSLADFSNLITPVLMEAHANPTVTVIVELVLSELQSLTGPTAHVHTANAQSLKPLMSPADFKKAFNQKIDAANLGAQYHI